MKLVSVKGHVELVNENNNWILSKETGFSPLETLIAATAACSTYVYLGILDKQRIDCTLQSVHVDYERNEDQELCPVSEINIQFLLSVDSANETKATKDLQLIAKNCTVARSLNPEIKVVESVQFV
ncbi:OsmC family protein [Sporolactobacillus sp. KGMB 08714]|uniref:OsmC family protein n=1 Tax=Sporolactobacillus sp. KGMB 08714 TaxID=3064704 RepID=UPI002FBE354D